MRTLLLLIICIVGIQSAESFSEYRGQEYLSKRALLLSESIEALQRKCANAGSLYDYITYSSAILDKQIPAWSAWLAKYPNQSTSVVDNIDRNLRYILTMNDELVPIVLVEIILYDLMPSKLLPVLYSGAISSVAKSGRVPDKWVNPIMIQLGRKRNWQNHAYLFSCLLSSHENELVVDLMVDYRDTITLPKLKLMFEDKLVPKKTEIVLRNKTVAENIRLVLKGVSNKWPDFIDILFSSKRQGSEEIKTIVLEVIAGDIKKINEWDKYLGVDHFARLFQANQKKRWVLTSEQWKLADKISKAISQ